MVINHGQLPLGLESNWSVVMNGSNLGMLADRQQQEHRWSDDVGITNSLTLRIAELFPHGAIAAYLG